MCPTESEWIQSLSLSLADGVSIDWDRAEGEAGASRSLVARLRSLEAIVKAHAEPSSPGAGPRAGESWGGLEIRELLGEGGQGSVYRAFDPRLRREVALKVYGERSAADAERLLSEARALARVRHPNVVLVYGADQREGRTGMWMELVRGETLSRRVRLGGPLEPPEAVRIGETLCRGVAAVHAAGMVHRDVKPSNVMLESDGRVVLMDFGIAVTPGEGHRERGFVRGTPVCMSPEQMAGEEATPGSDVYSIAVVLFHLLAGRYPFQAPDFEALREQVLRAPRAGLAGLPDGLPRELEELIRSGLSVRPEDRPGSASDMAGILASLGSASPEPPFHSGGNLPRARTRFVGRERDFPRLRRSLEDGRLVTLTGAGGIGKTRFAVEAGHRFADAYPGGVWFVDLARVSDPSHVLQALAGALNLRDQETGTPARILARRLKHLPALIILDNCEHVLPGAVRLAEDLLDHCRTVTVLATSREPLGVQGERTQSVPPLDLPGKGGDDSEAVRLFRDRALAVRDDFEDDGTAEQRTAAICTRLDGHPLALELAAAWLDTLNLGELERLVASPEFDELRREGAGRQTSLEATVEWSYRWISPRDRRSFRAFSVFAGAFDLAAAAAVAGTDGSALDPVGRLLARSLVVREPGEGPSRYRMLEPLRRYGRRRCAEAGEADEVRNRHRRHFLGLVEEAARGLQGADVARWLDRLEEAHPDLLLALEDADEGQEERIRMGGLLWRFWFQRGHLEIGRGVLERLLHSESGDPASASAAVGDALNGLGGLCWGQGDYGAARKWIRAGLAVKTAREDRLGVARGISNLGSVRFDEGDYGGAARRFTESLRMFRELIDRPGIAGTLSNLGLVRYAGAEWGKAERLFRESLGIRRELEDQPGIVICCVKLGRIAYRRGDFEGSEELLREAASLARGMRDPVKVAFALEGWAGLMLARGEAIRDRDPDAAEEAYRQCARLRGASTRLVDEIGGSHPTDERLEQEDVMRVLEARLAPSRRREVWERGRAEGMDVVRDDGSLSG